MNTSERKVPCNRTKDGYPILDGEGKSYLCEGSSHKHTSLIFSQANSAHTSRMLDIWGQNMATSPAKRMVSYYNEHIPMVKPLIDRIFR